jgi:hypothetical protein
VWSKSPGCAARPARPSRPRAQPRRGLRWHEPGEVGGGPASSVPTGDRVVSLFSTACGAWFSAGTDCRRCVSGQLFGCGAAPACRMPGGAGACRYDDARAVRGADAAEALAGDVRTGWFGSTGGAGPGTWLPSWAAARSVCRGAAAVARAASRSILPRSPAPAERFGAAVHPEGAVGASDRRPRVATVVEVVAPAPRARLRAGARGRYVERRRRTSSRRWPSRRVRSTKRT